LDNTALWGLLQKLPDDLAIPFADRLRPLVDDDWINGPSNEFLLSLSEPVLYRILARVDNQLTELRKRLFWAIQATKTRGLWDSGSPHLRSGATAAR